MGRRRALPASPWSLAALRQRPHIERGERVWVGVDVGGERCASTIVCATEGAVGRSVAAERRRPCLIAARLLAVYYGMIPLHPDKQLGISICVSRRREGSDEEDLGAAIAVTPVGG